jgi:hypothetical protein
LIESAIFSFQLPDRAPMSRERDVARENYLPIEGDPGVSVTGNSLPAKGRRANVARRLGAARRNPSAIRKAAALTDVISGRIERGTSQRQAPNQQRRKKIELVQSWRSKYKIFLN